MTKKTDEPKVINLKLWNKVSTTNPRYTKEVKRGNFKLTAINAAYQIRTATEQWGLYGTTWGLKDIGYEFHKDFLPDNQVMCVAHAVFYYPGGEFQITSSIMVVEYIKSWAALKVDSDFAKKIETDVLTKSLSKLGFNADVFLGLYDDNKYIATITEQLSPKPKPPAAKPKPPVAQPKPQAKEPTESKPAAKKKIPPAPKPVPPPKEEKNREVRLSKVGYERSLKIIEKGDKADLKKLAAFVLTLPDTNQFKDDLINKLEGADDPTVKAKK